MNWDAIGAIGQMLGSLAVFITLGYLAVQVKHARKDARRALSQSRGEALRHLYAQEGDERLAHLTTKASAALGQQPTSFTLAMEQAGLTREEAAEVLWTQLSWWNYRVQIIPNLGELSAMERTAFDVGTRSAYGQPGLRRVFYETYIKANAHPDAVRYIDNLLAQPG